MAFRVTEWINQHTVGSIMRKLINTNHRKVKKKMTDSKRKFYVTSETFCAAFYSLHSVYYSLVLYILSLCLDYKKGFGGSFGIQSDRVDKSAHGWEYVESVDKHASQTGEN